MTTRTPAEVYAALRAAGFDPAAALTMTAIAGAESGFDDTNLGDVGLENNTWGPSFGLFQIRTLKGETGHGSDRDINALTGDDVRQARAAFDISGGGRNFAPWSVWTSGKYRDFLGQAQAAAGGGAALPAGSFATGATPVRWGPGWLPWNWLPDAAAGTLGGVREIAIEGVFVLLGLGLLGAGAAAALAPRVKKRAQDAGKVAKVAAVVA